MNITSKRWAEMWCELNCWETPKELGPKLIPEKELGGAMRVCEIMTTAQEIHDAWTAMIQQNQKPKRVARRAGDRK